VSIQFHHFYSSSHIWNEFSYLIIVPSREPISSIIHAKRFAPRCRSLLLVRTFPAITAVAAEAPLLKKVGVSPRCGEEGGGRPMWGHANRENEGRVVALVVQPSRQPSWLFRTHYWTACPQSGYNRVPFSSAVFTDCHGTPLLCVQSYLVVHIRKYKCLQPTWARREAPLSIHTKDTSTRHLCRVLHGVGGGRECQGSHDSKN
jgi:hypothetical protein